MTSKTVTIIGLGKVGTSWLNILPEIGYTVHSVYNRSKAVNSLKNKHPQTLFLQEFPRQKSEMGDFIILAIADDAIEKMAEKLAHNISDFTEKYFIHCSGVLSSEALEAVRRKGAKTASFHPIKAITKKNKTFEGTWFDMEGDEELLIELEKLCDKLGANSFRIIPEAKPFLHASAVVASNYLVVLAEMLKKISAKGGVQEETALKAMAPLMQNTLANIEELGTVEALTGPIARGDVQTIQRHLKSLQNESNLLSLYKHLGQSAVEIAKEKSGNSEELTKIMKLLT